jgi:acetaldehyde dehydrogenase
VQGLGDYLPRYAGNLDIINCAALAAAEAFAAHRLSLADDSERGRHV